MLLCLYRLTCVYTSCKVEENHVSAEELGKGIQQDHQMILNNEMIVLQVSLLFVPSPLLRVLYSFDIPTNCSLAVKVLI